MSDEQKKTLKNLFDTGVLTKEDYDTAIAKIEQGSMVLDNADSEQVQLSTRVFGDADQIDENENRTLVNEDEMLHSKTRVYSEPQDIIQEKQSSTFNEKSAGRFQSSTNSKPEWVLELSEIKALFDAGALSQEEFEREKSKVLSQKDQTQLPPKPASSLDSNDKIGSYNIIDVIGEGGMGTVYRGRHQNEPIAMKQGGDVAIKMMHSQYAKRPELRERFNREVSMCVKLNHPGIVRVHDLVEEQGRLAMIMEYIKGQPLSEFIGSVIGPIPWPKAKVYFDKLLDAVSYAHSMKIVHRDIKPENIMVLEDESVRILDFGIAKDAEGSKTKTGTGMGTVNYMAPEQYRDAKNVDHRADIYALGMTLYEMLAGRLPWDSETTEFDILTIKANQTLPPPTDFYPHIPEHVVYAIERCIESDMNKRVGTIEELKKIITGNTLPLKAQSTKPPQPIEQTPVKNNSIDRNLESETKKNDTALNKNLIFGVLGVLALFVMFMVTGQDDVRDSNVSKSAVLKTPPAPPSPTKKTKSSYRSELRDFCTDEEAMMNLGKRALSIRRNSFYALRGRQFKTDWLQDHFDNTDWYEIDYSYSDDSVSFQEWEKWCIKTIRSYEK